MKTLFFGSEAEMTAALGLVEKTTAGGLATIAGMPVRVISLLPPDYIFMIADPDTGHVFHVERRKEAER
jgi:hypothetical protein